MARQINDLFESAIKVLAFLAGVLLIIMMLSVSVEVIMRYFLNSPILGLFEIVEVALLYITFLGVAWVLKLEKHVKIDMVLNLLNPKAQSLINTFTSVICTAMCFTITWYGTLVTWEHFETGRYIIGAINIPSGPFLLIIPIGSLLLSIQFLIRTYEYLRIWRTP